MPTRSTRAALLALAVLALGPARDRSAAPADAAGALPHAHAFELERPAEVVARIRADCRGCAWGSRGREAVVLRLAVDGRYSQHLALVRGARPAEYAVALGALGAGPHRLQLTPDPGWTSPGVEGVEVAEVRIEAVHESSTRHPLLAHAPLLHARRNTIGRFSDVPLLMWVEDEATPRGRRLRYSVVFSNEDGGTPPDRLLATWGRLTDIEYVYGVELDREGQVLAAQYQGRGHEIRPFAGERQGLHPLLHVVTDNNMLSDRGRAGPRFAPAPLPFDLTGVSREAVMDAHPWTYHVSSEEVRREGRVAPGMRPGDERIPDPRRFAYLEACADTRDAALAFAVGLAGADGGATFHASDGGLADFRIQRSADHFPNGCFRGAVALPEGTVAEQLRALRVRAFTRAPRKGEPPLPSGAGAARLLRVNRLFLLGADDQPGPNLLEWSGDAPLPPEGPAHELPIGG